LDKLSGKVESDSTDKKIDLNNGSSKQLDTLTDEQKIIPIKEERFSVSTETIAEDVKIEKRWVTKTKKIAVPLINEEIYVNGRRLRYYDKLKGISLLAKARDRLREGLDRVTNDKKEQGYSLLEANESKREIIPLFEGGKSGDSRNNDDSGASNKEIEKVIPVFGEELLITKRRVKVGELAIKKNRVTVNNKIEIDIKKEEAAVRHPDGIKPGTEEI